MKKALKNIPILPLSAIIFYACILILWSFGLIPSSGEVIGFLENLYEGYGLIGLFIATFFEGLAYVGLYFAGSFIILAIVLFSDGKFLSLLNISLIVALALTITSIINYVLGRHIIRKPKETREIKKKRKNVKGFFLSALHPNALAFYFFNLGLKKKEFWQIILVPLIMIPYGFLVAYLIYLTKPFIESNFENPYILITVLLVWFIIALILKEKSQKT
jgi:lysylphosphatidylglycerol synthetase-like protein (DUF2156 family)